MTVHFVGVGGIGMSALAQILIQRGVVVSGSDSGESSRLRDLRNLGAAVHVGHHPVNVPQGARIVYSSDIPSANPELCHGREMGYPIVHRAELLNELMKEYKALVVTGTHGKTTVSALLAWLLMANGLDPAFALGGVVKGLPLHGRHGQGDYFVAEGDESDASFLHYSPYGAIITNVEADHLDHFKSLDNVQKAFGLFVERVLSSEHLVWCGDDPWLASQGLAGLSYGLSPTCMLRATEIVQRGFETQFLLQFDGVCVARMALPLSGMHNVVNALAVSGMGRQLGLTWEQIATALATFPGVHRRLERIGEPGGVLICDDYAHHPTEVKVTLAGLRCAVGGRRIIAVVQPHRYSRWAGLLDAFADSFEDADEVIVTDVYAKGEIPLPGLDGPSLATRLRGTYISRTALASELTARVRRRDVIITLGAGDITQVAYELLNAVERSPPPKLSVGVIYGGVSPEYPVSLSSAQWFIAGTNSEHYDKIALEITPRGEWVVDGVAHRDLRDEILDRLRRCDVVIPVLHGDRGEDGLMAALLETLDLSHVGCDFRSASLFMDKVLTKHVAQSLGIKTAPFVDFWRAEWRRDSQGCLDRLNGLSYPLFVKPTHLGSSFGVSRVETSQQLVVAIEQALALDNRVVIEEEICGREIEFCVLGNRGQVSLAPPAEILKSGAVHTFSSKYGEQACPIDLHPRIDPSVARRGCEQAHAVFRAIGGRDLGRIDFFLDTHDQWWLNEVNPFPGCTPTSAFPLAWEAAGLQPTEVIEHLIMQALNREYA